MSLRNDRQGLNVSRRLSEIKKEVVIAIEMVNNIAKKKRSENLLRKIKWFFFFIKSYL